MTTNFERKYIMKFNVRANINDKKITVLFPPSLSVDRATGYFDEKTGILTIERDPSGLKLGKAGEKKRLQLARKKWADNAPVGKYKREVEWKDGKCLIKLCSPVVTVTQDQKVLVPRSGQSKREMVSAALKLINQYASENGFNITVKDNAVQLEKVEIIS